MQSIPLGHLIEIAALVLDVDRAQIRRVMKIPLAESALSAPYAGYGDYERYVTLAEKAGVLCCRLARNHCLPDGNKRVAFLAMVEFLESQGHGFDDSDQEHVAVTIEAMAGGEITELAFIAWTSERITTKAPR